MDWVKEIFDVANSKIKSPVLGSIVFAFCAVNWKPLFYLTFADATVIEKFGYFDTETTWVTLLVVPIIIGIFLSWFNPWVRLFALKFTHKPIQEVKMLQLSLASERIIKKQKLEEARREAIASEEEGLIAEAKRDQEILKIENNELREKLQKSIENVRDIEADDSLQNIKSDNIYMSELVRLKDLLKFYDERRDLAHDRGDIVESDDFDKKSKKVVAQIELLNDQTFFEKTS